MKKVYVCVGYGHSKETGEPYSRFNAKVEGKGYGFYNSKDSFSAQEIHELGEEVILSDD